MKAVRINDFGGPDVLRLEEIPVPKPGQNQALVRVVAAGVNFVDVYQRSGLYKVELPYTAGFEASGIVEKAGPGCELAPGTRVAWTMVLGAYAEHAIVHSERLVAIPHELGFDFAAAAILQGMTAHYLSETTFLAKARDTALVHAGAGGTGLLLIQMLKKKGTLVYTTVSTAEKAKLAKEAGADEAILYKEEDFVARTKELTGGRGVDVVYDSVGLATYQGDFDVLRPRGMLILFGQPSGKVPPIDPITLAEKGSLFLTRPSLAHYATDRQELLQRAGEVFGWVSDGTLRLRVERRYPLAEVAQAHRDLESRATTGKLLIDISA